MLWLKFYFLLFLSFYAYTIHIQLGVQSTGNKYVSHKISIIFRHFRRFPPTALERTITCSDGPVAVGGSYCGQECWVIVTSSRNPAPPDGVTCATEQEGVHMLNTSQRRTVDWSDRLQCSFSSSNCHRASPPQAQSVTERKLHVNLLFVGLLPLSSFAVIRTRVCVCVCSPELTSD